MTALQVFGIVALGGAALTCAGCVTNIAGKAAERCAPINSDAAAYSDCVSQVSAEMDAKNRNTARILAAGLGGAASTSAPQAYGGAPLKGSFVSGTNRICIYNDVGSDRYVTMRAVDLCPLTSQ